MKLKVFTEEGLEFLEHNLEANIKYYQEPKNNWIYDFIDEEKHVKEFHTEVSDFELLVDKTDASKTDTENVKTLYTNLKFLTNEQASDNRFWAGLTHFNFWEFMYRRWDIGEKKQDIKNVKDRYFIGMGTSYRRSLIVNTISKYWWVGKKTYDEDSQDSFHLLKYFQSDYAARTLNLLSSSYANNDEIIRYTVEALIELEEDLERRLSRKEFRSILRYLNILGGISVLDYFSKDVLKDKIKNNFHKNI